jgi:hypothetical protein
MRNWNNYINKQRNTSLLTPQQVATAVNRVNQYIKKNDNQEEANKQRKLNDEKRHKRRMAELEAQSKASENSYQKKLAEKEAKKAANKAIEVELYRAVAYYMITKNKNHYLPEHKIILKRIAGSKNLSKSNMGFLKSAVNGLTQNEKNKMVMNFKQSRASTPYFKGGF